MPKNTVDIIMTTYNHENFIEEAIVSVLNQTYLDWKLYIGVELSKDNTAKIVAQYVARYPEKIIAIYHQEHQGISVNFNKLIDAGTGKYICIFSGDDVMLPDKISSQVEALDKHCWVSVCGHKIDIFNSNTNKTLRFYNDFFTTDCLQANLVKESVLNPCLFAPISIFTRRKLLQEIKFNEEIPYLADWLLSIDLAKRGEASYINKVLARYRRHDNNITKIGNAEVDEYFIACSLIKKRYPELKKYVQAIEVKYTFYYSIKLLLKFNSFKPFFLLGKSLYLMLFYPYVGLFVIKSIFNTLKRRIFSI